MPVRPPLPPNTSPSGRKISPETARIAGLPGGMDYLAGFGPAPAGVTDFNPAPIIHNAVLGGNPRPPETFQQMISRWSTSASPFGQLGAQKWGALGPQAYNIAAHTPPAQQPPWAVGMNIPPVPPQITPPQTTPPPAGGSGAGAQGQTPMTPYTPPTPTNMGYRPSSTLPYGGFGIPGLVYGKRR